MPVERMRMRPWLEEQINSQAIPGLRWINKEQKIFQIPWKHAAHQGFDVNRDACLFKNWAVHTGKHRPDREGDPKSWKTNFRCALNSLPDVKELRDKSKKKGENAYRVYVMLPAHERHKRRKGSLAKNDKLNGMASDNDHSGTVKGEGGSDHRQRMHIKLENCRLLTSSQIQKMLCESLIDKITDDDDNHDGREEKPAERPGHSSHHLPTFPERRPDVVSKAGDLSGEKLPVGEMPSPLADNRDKLNDPSVVSCHAPDLPVKREVSPHGSNETEQEEGVPVLYALQTHPLATQDCGHGNLTVLATQCSLKAGAAITTYGLQEEWRNDPQQQNHDSPLAHGTQEPTSSHKQEELHSTASAVLPDIKDEMFYPEWSQMVEVKTENPDSDDSYNLQISSGASSEDDSDMETDDVDKSSPQTSRARNRHLQRETSPQRRDLESWWRRNECDDREGVTGPHVATRESFEEHGKEPPPTPHADNAQYLQSRRTASVIVRLGNGKPGTDSDPAATWPSDSNPGCEQREEQQHEQHEQHEQHHQHSDQQLCRPEQEDQTEEQQQQQQQALNQQHHQHHPETAVFHMDKIHPAWVPTMCHTTTPFLSSVNGSPGTSVSYVWPSHLSADAAGRHEIVVIPQGHVLGMRSNIEFLVIPHHPDAATAVIHG